MPPERRSYPTELKVQIALEALREESTLAELATAPAECTGWAAHAAAWLSAALHPQTDVCGSSDSRYQA